MSYPGERRRKPGGGGFRLGRFSYCTGPNPVTGNRGGIRGNSNQPPPRWPTTVESGYGLLHLLSSLTVSVSGSQDTSSAKPIRADDRPPLIVKPIGVIVGADQKRNYAAHVIPFFHSVLFSGPIPIQIVRRINFVSRFYNRVRPKVQVDSDGSSDATGFIFFGIYNTLIMQ